MNEPAAFDTNLDKPFNWPPDKPDWNLKCPINEWDDPPYITCMFNLNFPSFSKELKVMLFFHSQFQVSAARSATKRLSDKTICMVGRQGQNNEYLHYEVHNLFGWSQTAPTSE